MAPRDEVIMLVNEYMQDISNTSYDYADPQLLSYSKAVGRDILRGLIKTNKAPLIFLEEYKEKMDNFYEVRKDLIFETGGRVTQYFIDLLTLKRS